MITPPHHHHQVCKEVTQPTQMHDISELDFRLKGFNVITLRHFCSLLSVKEQYVISSFAVTLVPYKEVAGMEPPKGGLSYFD